MTELNKNRAGLEKKDYSGGVSTLCTGCGHDSISQHIINAYYQLGIHPHDVVKTSGIGCSSKLPGYFLNKSYGINSMHGRMAPVSIGAKTVSRDLNMVGVSGDGDSASIGLGGFLHLIRRNLPMVYIVANNGVYGLTKGQFSATADQGAKLKSGELNPFAMMDMCSMAIEVGATFVARSFSGDNKQMVSLLKAAIQHRGTAVIDVISPCITFNNHDQSTRSYAYVKEHDIHLQELGFIAPFEEKIIESKPGELVEVELPDGGTLWLRALDSRAHDVKDRLAAQKVLFESRKKGEIVTGVFYIDEKEPNLVETLNLTNKPLRELNEKELRPNLENFQKKMLAFR